MSFTPGPWKLSGSSIHANDGRPIGACYAGLEGYSSKTPQCTNPEMYANARLIVQAPAMLDALKGVLESGELSDGVAAIVRAVIAEAER